MCADGVERFETALRCPNDDSWFAAERNDEGGIWLERCRFSGNDAVRGSFARVRRHQETGDRIGDGGGSRHESDGQERVEKPASIEWRSRRPGWKICKWCEAHRCRSAMLSWQLLEVLMFRRALAVTAFGSLIALPAAAQDLKAKGEKVFTDQKCSLCHSVAGKGNVKGPLDDVGGKLSAADIRAWITDANAMTAKIATPRKPVMKQYSLPKEDVDALVAYLTTLKK
jgi:mono/diheme cytochrome c family protein